MSTFLCKLEVSFYELGLVGLASSTFTTLLVDKLIEISHKRADALDACKAL